MPPGVSKSRVFLKFQGLMCHPVEVLYHHLTLLSCTKRSQPWWISGQLLHNKLLYGYWMQGCGRRCGTAVPKTQATVQNTFFRYEPANIALITLFWQAGWPLFIQITKALACLHGEFTLKPNALMWMLLSNCFRVKSYKWTPSFDFIMN